MKTINIMIILIFNVIGAFISYQWCYSLIIRKHHRFPPESHYLIFYGLCYFCFFIISIVLLKKTKRPTGLVIYGVLIGVLINFILAVLYILIMSGGYDKSLFNIEFIMGVLCVTSLFTLNFIIYPAILLCCHYSIGGIQKILSKIVLKQ